MSKEEIYAKLKESITEMDEDLAEEAANEALEAGLDPLECISSGLSAGKPGTASGLCTAAGLCSAGSCISAACL